LNGTARFRCRCCVRLLPHLPTAFPACHSTTPTLPSRHTTPLPAWRATLTLVLSILPHTPHPLPHTLLPPTAPTYQPLPPHDSLCVPTGPPWVPHPHCSHPHTFAPLPTFFLPLLPFLHLVSPLKHLHTTQFVGLNLTVRHGFATDRLAAAGGGRHSLTAPFCARFSGGVPFPFLRRGSRLLANANLTCDARGRCAVPPPTPPPCTLRAGIRTCRYLRLHTPLLPCAVSRTFSHARPAPPPLYPFPARCAYRTHHAHHPTRAFTAPTHRYTPPHTHTRCLSGRYAHTHTAFPHPTTYHAAVDLGTHYLHFGFTCAGQDVMGSVVGHNIRLACRLAGLPLVRIFLPTTNTLSIPPDAHYRGSRALQRLYLHTRHTTHLPFPRRCTRLPTPRYCTPACHTTLLPLACHCPPHHHHLAHLHLPPARGRLSASINTFKLLPVHSTAPAGTPRSGRPFPFCVSAERDFLVYVVVRATYARVFALRYLACLPLRLRWPGGLCRARQRLSTMQTGTPHCRRPSTLATPTSLLTFRFSNAENSTRLPTPARGVYLTDRRQARRRHCDTGAGFPTAAWRCFRCARLFSRSPRTPSQHSISCLFYTATA